MTIKIYGTEASRAMRPIWTAEEMGLDYELEMMPFPPRVSTRIFRDQYVRNYSVYDRWKCKNDGIRSNGSIFS